MMPCPCACPLTGEDARPQHAVEPMSAWPARAADDRRVDVDLFHRHDYVQQIVRIALKRFADTRTTSKGSRRLRQVDDSIRPVPSATFTEPEVGHQARLVAVVGTPNRAAEQDEAAVTFPRAQDLARVPRSEEHTSELQSPDHLVCRLLLEKKKPPKYMTSTRM